MSKKLNTKTGQFYYSLLNLLNFDLRLFPTNMYLNCDYEKEKYGCIGVTSFYSMVVFYLKERLSIDNRYLYDGGNCTEDLGMCLQVVPVQAPQCTPVFQAFVVCFMSCANGGFLFVAEVVATCWCYAPLVTIPVASICQVVLPWIQGVHQ